MPEIRFALLPVFHDVGGGLVVNGAESFGNLETNGINQDQSSICTQ
jgi:hypothetical protein